MPACSRSDHDDPLACSPIFGCAANASSQSAGARDRQIASPALAMASKLSNGRAAAIERAQEVEPQHRANAAWAASRLSWLMASMVTAFTTGGRAAAGG